MCADIWDAAMVEMAVVVVEDIINASFCNCLPVQMRCGRCRCVVVVCLYVHRRCAHGCAQWMDSLRAHLKTTGTYYLRWEVSASKRCASPTACLLYVWPDGTSVRGKCIVGRGDIEAQLLLCATDIGACCDIKGNKRTASC
jgi:hypothetical protein